MLSALISVNMSDRIFYLFWQIIYYIQGEISVVYSMTGYGRGLGSIDGMSLTIELRSVNHRHIDLFFRIPRELQRWEETLRSIIKEKISRGRIEVTVNIDDIPEDIFNVRVNRSLLKAYNDALEEVKDILSLTHETSLSHLLKFSDILTIENKIGDDSRTENLLREALNEALQSLEGQRLREGSNLKNDLLQRCELVEKHTKSLQERVPLITDFYREKLEQKLKDLEEGFFDESRILTECAIFADRSDVSEELVRLRSHFGAFRETLNSEGPVGRKMDFMLQEMFREINTVGSKGNDYEVAGLVVQVKTELEKMREQVQNLE